MGGGAIRETRNGRVVSLCSPRVMAAFRNATTETFGELAGCTHPWTALYVPYVSGAESLDRSRWVGNFGMGCASGRNSDWLTRTKSELSSACLLGRRSAAGGPVNSPRWPHHREDFSRESRSRFSYRGHGRHSRYAKTNVSWHL